MAGKGPSLGGGNESVDLGSSDGGAEQQGTHHEAGDLAARETFHLPSLCSLPQLLHRRPWNRAPWRRARSRS